MPIAIRVAKFSEHKSICAIAKQSKFTKDFSNKIFSGEDCYGVGRIRVVTNYVGMGPWEPIVGFTCFRHRVRVKPVATVLYFITVDETWKGKGLGTLLMSDLEKLAPSGLVELKVNKENPAVQFYERLGYRVCGEAYNGEGLVLRKARAGVEAR